MSPVSGSSFADADDEASDNAAVSSNGSDHPGRAHSADASTFRRRRQPSALLLLDACPRRPAPPKFVGAASAVVAVEGEEGCALWRRGRQRTCSPRGRWAAAWSAAAAAGGRIGGSRRRGRRCERRRHRRVHSRASGSVGASGRWGAVGCVPEAASEARGAVSGRPLGRLRNGSARPPQPPPRRVRPARRYRAGPAVAPAHRMERRPEVGGSVDVERAAPRRQVAPHSGCTGSHPWARCRHAWIGVRSGIPGAAGWGLRQRGQQGRSPTRRSRGILRPSRLPRPPARRWSSRGMPVPGLPSAPQVPHTRSPSVEATSPT